MQRGLAVLITACALFLIADYDGGQQGAGRNVAVAAPGAPTSAPRPVSRHDPSSLVACDLVRPEEVAQIAGGRLLTPPSATGPSCMYVVAVGDDTESYHLVFEPVAMVEELIRAQSDAEKGESVPGPWDEGYVQPEPLGAGVHFIVLWRGTIAMEVSGPRKGQVIEIGRLAASRMP